MNLSRATDLEHALFSVEAVDVHADDVRARVEREYILDERLRLALPLHHRRDLDDRVGARLGEDA